MYLKYDIMNTIIGIVIVLPHCPHHFSVGVGENCDDGIGDALKCAFKYASSYVQVDLARDPMCSKSLMHQSKCP